MALLISAAAPQQNLFLICPTLSLQAALATKWLLWRPALAHIWFQPVKWPEEPQLTCAGIVIDPDVARMADAHEGAGGVNAHGVLPAVVLPLSALINI